LNAQAPIVHVVDDDDSFRTALLRLLEAAGYLARGYASAGDFLIARPGDAPGCLLLDIQMPGPSGLELQAARADHGVALPIVFLTGHGDVPMSVRAMKAGAFDFLQKPVAADTLMARVYAALRLDEGRRADRTQAEQARLRLERLTGREREVLTLLLRGRSNKQVAKELRVSPRTAEVHRRNILLKTQTVNLLEIDKLHRLARRDVKKP